MNPRPVLAEADE